MKTKRIEIIKDWPQPKSACDIQVFLGFANFYPRFIYDFSKIAALLTSILKTTRLPDKPALSKNDNSKSAFSKNDNSRPASKRNNGDSEIDGFGVSENNMKHAKKSRKLSKLRKSKNKKTFKS